MNEYEYKKMFLQEPRSLEIGDVVKLNSPQGLSIKPVDTNLYEVIEFLDKGHVKISQMFSEKTRIIDSGRIGEIITEDKNG